MNVSQHQTSNHLTTGGGTYRAVNGFLSGGVSDKYEVKLITPDKKKAYPRIWSANEVIKNIPYLTSKNELSNTDEIFDIYIRPLDDRFILLDDLNINILSALAIIKPCLLMETSPGNFQSWVKLQQVPPERSAQLQIWRTLAAMFKADMNSAKPEQIGRLPGFFNRKVKYSPDYPFVKLHNFLDRFSTWESGNPQSTIPPPVVNQHHANNSKAGKDRSAFDYAIVCSMIERGKTDDEIRSYLLLKSDKAKARNDDYVGRTINKARKKKQRF